jgi:AcrR family transcriptional regulator
MPHPHRPTKKELVTEFRTREILAAARNLLEQGGVEGLTMDGIAAAAGVAKGTIYLYFPSKEELLQELLSHVGEDIINALQSIIKTSQSPEEKLQRVVTWLMHHLARERLLFPAFLRELRREHAPVPGQRRYLQEFEIKITALLTDLFAEGIAQGRFIPANPRLLSYILRGLVRAVGHYQMTKGEEAAVKEALPVLLTLLSSGLTPKSPTAAEVVTP